MAIAALTMTGCAATSATYASPEALHEAYVDAGGECADPQEVPESMVGDGAHALLCIENVTMLIVFDTADAKNRYLAQTGDVGEAISGERWAAVGPGLHDLADTLGGESA